MRTSKKAQQFIVSMFILFLISFSCCESVKRENSLGSQFQNVIPYSVKAVYPHDEKAFTQGLVIHNGRLYEGTGYHNLIKSWIAEVDLESGKQDKKVELEKYYFGEGICILNEKMFQLTWKENIAFIYELETFKNIGSFEYEGEGWGITTDGEFLIMSDGTSKLSYLDTLNFQVAKQIFVIENGFPVNRLNELEFIDGFVFANQWESNYIFKIDPQSGMVVGRIDLTPLVNEVKRTSRKANVANGVAYNRETGDILVTGKLWPKSYLIQLGK